MKSSQSIILTQRMMSENAQVATIWVSLKPNHALCLYNVRNATINGETLSI